MILIPPNLSWLGHYFVCLVFAGTPGDPGVPGSVGPKGELIKSNSLSSLSHLDKKTLNALIPS